ncbi:MAG: helix-turn-helix transcriptional regulator, partial [Pseudonocardiales bacterium]|nr:helix-turn-helix transcriptional regulator [Pseudonocardiales bacterium]
PDLIARPDVRAFLAARDISALYRVLSEHGWSQRRIAKATRTQQPEISEIVKGRKVIGYDVLVRIAEGLGIPRERMGLSFGAYADELTTAEPPKGVDEDVLRRHFEHLLALGAVATFGTQIERIGELAPGLAASGGPVDLPSRTGTVDVVPGSAGTLSTCASWHAPTAGRPGPP